MVSRARRVGVPLSKTGKPIKNLGMVVRSLGMNWSGMLFKSEHLRPSQALRDTQEFKEANLGEQSPYYCRLKRVLDMYANDTSSALELIDSEGLAPARVSLPDFCDDVFSVSLSDGKWTGGWLGDTSLSLNAADLMNSEIASIFIYDQSKNSLVIQPSGRLLPNHSLEISRRNAVAQEYLNALTSLYGPIVRLFTLREMGSLRATHPEYFQDGQGSYYLDEGGAVSSNEKGANGILVRWIPQEREIIFNEGLVPSMLGIQRLRSLLEQYRTDFVREALDAD